MPPPSHQRRKTERPEELLGAALALFIDRGFAATRMEDVARQAGVSKGTVYLYWSSKEDLLRAVITRFLGTLLDAGADRLARHEGSVIELLRTVYADWWIDVLRSPVSGVFKLMLSEARNFPEVARFYQQEVVERGNAIIRALLERGISAGELRAVDVEAATFSLLMPMVMLCIHQHALEVCRPFDTQGGASALVKGHIELLLPGLLRAEGPSKIAGFPAAARLGDA